MTWRSILRIRIVSSGVARRSAIGSFGLWPAMHKFVVLRPTDSALRYIEWPCLLLLPNPHQESQCLSGRPFLSLLVCLFDAVVLTRVVCFYDQVCGALGDTGRVLLGFFLALGIGIVLKSEVRRHLDLYNRLAAQVRVKAYLATRTCEWCACIPTASYYVCVFCTSFPQDVDNEDLYRIINMPGMLWLNGLKLCVLPLIGTARAPAISTLALLAHGPCPCLRLCV